MNETEARVLVAYLNASYPRESMEQETFDVYAKALMPLRAPLAARAAVEGLVLTNKNLPSIAEVREAYSRYAERAKLELEGQERRELEAGVTPEERARVGGEIRKLVEHLGGAPAEEAIRAGVGAMTAAPVGRCDDCRLEGAQRVVYGQFEVCYGCASSRLRAKPLGEVPA